MEQLQNIKEFLKVKLPIQYINNVLNSIPRKFIIEKYNYDVLKIIPYKSSYTDKEYEKIINTIAKYNKPFLDRFELRTDKKTLVYHPEQPISFEALYTKDKISYFYAMPTIYRNVFYNKLKFLLDKSDIVQVEDPISSFKGSLKQSFEYKKNWIFAINTNDKLNIADNLLVLHKDLQTDNDQILMQLLMQPQFDYQWKNKWETQYKKFSETGLISNGANIWENIDSIFNFVMLQTDYIINAVMLAIAGEEPLTIENQKPNYTKDLNVESKHKNIYDGFKTNLNLYIKTKDPITAQNISRNAITVMQDLNGDNSFKLNKSKTCIEVNRDIHKGFILNTMECKQLIKTPSEALMKEYESIIDKINVADIDMPKDLFDKGVQLGEMKKGSIYKPIYFGSDPDSNSKPFVFISPMGGGKSSFSRMYSVAYAEQGDSVVLFETIDGKSKEVVRDYLAKGFPEEKIIVLDYADDDFILPLLWNEITDVYLQKLEKAKNDMEKYRILEELSGIISTQLKGFIDTIQIESRDQMLTPQMSKILNNITQLVFMNDGTFGMVKDCLWDNELRHKLLDSLYLPTHLPFCREIIKIDLEPSGSLTLKGIESRLNILMDNMTMKKIFSVNPKNKINFSKWVNEGYVLIINVPESTFGDNINPIITFLMAKLWMCLLSSRTNIPEKDRKLCHIVMDEIHRFPHCLNLLQNKILECRKWHIRPTFYIHSMDVFSRMYENLKAAGTTFVMMPTSEYNFSRVREFYQPYGFDELKEVEKLNAKYPKSRFALCSIHYKNVNYPCVVKLLQPVENRYKRTDRSYLDKKYAEMYGVKQDDYYNDLFNIQTDNNVTDNGNNVIDDEDVDI